MLGQLLKTGAQLLLVLSFVYFVRSCYGDKQDIQIVPVTQPKQWTYDITTIPLGERMYDVLIDGELNGEAALDYKLHRTTSNATRNRPDTTFIEATTSILPKGKFSVYYSRDDSGPEEFAYHPLTATKGWVRIQIRPGQWNWKDSSRTLLGSHSHRSYPIAIKKRSALNKFVFHP